MITDILTVAMKEIKELPYLRKDKSRTNLFTLVILLAVFGVLLPWHAGREWVQSLLSMLPCVWLPFMLVGTTMVDSFAGERERHTLETLLASRLSDRAILFGKILAGILYGAGITFLCMLVSLVTVNLVDGQAGLLLFPVPNALGLVILVLLVSTLASALGALVSLRAASVRQAMQTFTVANAVLLIPVLAISLVHPALLATITPLLLKTSFIGLVVGAGVVLTLLDGTLIVAALASFKRAKLILD
ncbi:MAG: ABC transporter permease [Anaerolineales bacterium]